MWDFETGQVPAQARLGRGVHARRTRKPLDHAPLDPYDKKNPRLMAVLRPLQQKVKEQGLWAATHLSPDLGGQGYGQVQLALLNEIVGASAGRQPFRLPGAGLRECGDLGAVRHRGAEAALFAAVARR